MVLSWWYISTSIWKTSTFCGESTTTVRPSSAKTEPPLAQKRLRMKPSISLPPERPKGMPAP